MTRHDFRNKQTSTLAVADIEVAPDRLRALRVDTVNELAESMAKSGLLQPIVVHWFDGGYWLIAGWHRLEATKKLKLKTIRAWVFNGMDANQAKLAEIDENLVRAELSAAERALHIDARKTLYEKAHPEAKHGGDRKSEKSKSQNESLKAFVDDTAKKTGKGRSTIARDATRGKKGRTWLRQVAGTSLDQGTEIDAMPA